MMDRCHSGRRPTADRGQVRTADPTVGSAVRTESIGHGPAARRHLAGNHMPPGWRRSGWAQSTRRASMLTDCF